MLSSLLIDWIKTLLKNQESCVINRGHTTKYFKLEKGARQGDPISAYLFVLALEIFFVITKTNNIHGLKIFVHYFFSNFNFSPNDSPSETIKKVFYFI